MIVSGHILVVDPDAETRKELARALAKEEHRVTQATDGDQAMDLLTQHGFQLVITDLSLPGISGLELIDYIRKHTPSTPVIVLTEEGSVETAVGAMRRGAFDFLEKPYSQDKLLFAVERSLEKATLHHAYHYLRHEQPYIHRIDRIVAESPAMKKVIDQVMRVSNSDATVLLTGETGVGKSLIAGAIHFNSPRRAGNLLTVNCAALAETLLESELFGHEKGSFTGAHKARTGRFQQAHGGTLFLDEVGDMSPAVQAKVLRAIEERTIERLGGVRSIHVDVRIIAATNLDLDAGVADGRFREDLYYRLKVASIHIPPLKERREDIIPLAEMFLQRTTSDSGYRPLALAEEAKQALLAHDWPGNIREMRNAVERAMLFCRGQEVTARDLDLGPPRTDTPEPVGFDTLDLTELERRAIVTALERTNWIQRKAAALLGITPRGLSYKIDKLGITHPELEARRRRR